ncbi:MAG: CoA-binding protein [Candidatus Micrarchaeota archaeon]|nr:CoA-binding protein [Candidatus Micrarchaeota archaeon]
MEDEIKKILQMKTVAIIGLSDNQERPSYHVGRYLVEAGYDVIPVNPNMQEWLGKKSYPSLATVPHKVDVVDVFRKSEAAAGIVQEAIAIKARAVWLQEGVRSAEAEKIAREAGILFVMDKCIMKEHKRLYGKAD